MHNKRKNIYKGRKFESAMLLIVLAFCSYAVSELSFFKNYGISALIVAVLIGAMIGNFAHQNFISGYNDPFMQNFTRSTNVYREDASDLAIIDLFNFDRSLSSLLFSNIKQVESQLNTAITHEIARVLNENNYPNGNILKALEDTNILPYIFQAGVNKDSIRKTLLGNFGNKETKLSKKYPLTDNDVPI